MFAGPLFQREVITVPRQFKHFLMRAGYIAVLFVLMYTAGQATFGWQQVRNIGEIARFGNLIFQYFSLVQLTLVLFFALLFAAGRVAQEKDKRTLILLLMTDLRSRELVGGKLSSGLLTVGVLVFAAIPVFLFVHLMGGVSLGQILWAMAITATAAFTAGSWGVLVAYWREKTFQTLSISVLGMVIFLGVIEAGVRIFGQESLLGTLIGFFSPYRSLWIVLNPFSPAYFPNEVAPLGSVLALLILAGVLNGVAIARLRVWNPSRNVYEAAKEKNKEITRARTRNVWSNPVIWREIRTRAYGRKIIFIKLAYLAVSGYLCWQALQPAGEDLVLGMVPPAGAAFITISLLSLLLVNAQAVTSLTTERDSQTLELLLVTDVTAKEFIFGKLGGVLYNSKELIIVPLLLTLAFTIQDLLSVENLIYLWISFLILTFFSAMLGLHSGLSFDNSRSGIANSLGTMFFLFVGIFLFMMLLVEARSSFFIQFQSFLVFIGVGSIGLYASLTHKNPSLALTIAAGLLPFLTFYAITEFLLSGTLGVAIAIGGAYGFTAMAMLIPAISEFDVALGRTTLDKG